MALFSRLKQSRFDQQFGDVLGCRDPATSNGYQLEVQVIAVDGSTQRRRAGIFQKVRELLEFDELAIAIEQAGEQIGRLGHF